MDKNTLREVGEWAQARINSGEEPPWTFHKLKLLAGLTLELAEGLDAGVAYCPGLETSEATSRSSAENVIEFQNSIMAKEEPYTILPT